MSDTIITVENLGKRYSLRHQRDQRYVALRDVISEKTAGFFKKLKNGKADKLKSANGAASENLTSDRRHPTSDVRATHEDFWALKDVSFEVRRGEVLGIIGRNGAGKSTLLKILSRITEPTEGRVRIKGRVASLLEVGTGFHPELTGRENIYLNGAILGMTRAEIKKKFDEIVAFAETEKFLDTPVKRYSSGMYVRLAFAVAAHLEPEILVVDEVLAVGDAAFQEKCLGKMEKVASEGRTVLLVSHNMSTIQQLCSRCFCLSSGRIEHAGVAAEVVSKYISGSEPDENHDLRGWRDRSGTGEARLTQFEIIDSAGALTNQCAVGGTLCFYLEAEFYERLIDPCFGVVVHTSSGEPLLDLQSAHDGLSVGRTNDRIAVRATLQNVGLYPGRYLFSAWITDAAVQRSIDFVKMCRSIRVIPAPGRFGDLRLDPKWGKYWARSEWKQVPSSEALKVFSAISSG